MPNSSGAEHNETGGSIMRVSPLVPVAMFVLMSGSAAAQGWLEYTSQQDRFIVNFPGQPVVREIPYPTEFGITLPARVYTVQDGPNRYSITVVDYSPGQQIHADRAKGCKGYPDTCTNRWMNDLRGALDYAVSSYLQRDSKVTYYAFGDSDRVEGRRIQLTNTDQSRTFVAVYMHENRLYILDGTVSPSAPPPALFQQNFGFFDKDGIRIRYQTLYSNLYAAPPREETRGRLQGC